MRDDQLCLPLGEVSVSAATLSSANVYLDVSESMKGFISDTAHPMQVTPFQTLLQTLLLEKISAAGLATSLYSFGETERTTSHDLRELPQFVAQRDRYEARRSDIVAAMEKAEAQPEALSVIVTDNAQDLEYAQAGQGQRAAGFDRTAVVRAVAERLAQKGFGVWLLGVQSDFWGTYFSVQLSLSEQGVRSNKRIELGPGSRRPFYCWIISRNWETGRRLVTDLREELLRAIPTDESGLSLVNAVELNPGIAPDLRIQEAEPEELAPPAAWKRSRVPRFRDVLRVRDWRADEKDPGTARVKFVLETNQTSQNLYLIKALISPPKEPEKAALAISPRMWSIEPAGELGLSAQLGDASQRFAVPDTGGSGGEVPLRYWELSIPYERLTSLPRDRWVFSLPLRLRVGELSEGYWLYDWSSNDDTGVAGVQERTIYLLDVARAILRKTVGSRSRAACLAARIER